MQNSPFLCWLLILTAWFVSTAFAGAPLPGAALPGSPLPDTPTEIISGHPRSEQVRRAPSRQAEPGLHAHISTTHPSPAHTPGWLTPIKPLNPGTLHRLPKKMRKHRLDQDRDGYISKSEMEMDHQRRQAAFRSADQNLDGKLDEAEQRHYQALIQARGRHRAY